MKKWDDAQIGDLVLFRDGTMSGRITDTVGCLAKSLYITWDQNPDNEGCYTCAFSPFILICESEKERLKFILKYS
jgi:hypothetical protein